MNKVHLMLLGFAAVYAGLLLRSALKNYANVSI